MSSVKRSLVIGVVLCSLLTLQGCEKLSAFFNDFKDSWQAPGEKEASVAPRQKPLSTIPPATTPIKAKKNAPIAKNVLAKVGSWTITIEDFKERLNALKEVAPEYDINDVEQNKLILEELINQQLLVQEAEKIGLAQEKNIKLAVEEFRNTLFVREMAATIIQDVEVTDQEAENYYSQNVEAFTMPTEWRVREIMVATEDEAKAVVAELYQGADFIAKVKEKSKSKSAWQKGDLGFLSTFAFSEMANVVMSLEVGAVSGVFKGPDGFYIVKLEEKKGGEQKAFEEIKEEIKNGLMMINQQQTILARLQELRAAAVIRINEKLLEE
ncbi:MAG: peptidyl-prolyl cis-trans isomerase [Candidatus Omnitrophica bacterium]|nr:peptidyl-prolyl cis-trans isomerase [Candidatus Omnitrophota bacterium]